MTAAGQPWLALAASIGERLGQRRFDLNFTVEALARLCGIPTGRVFAIQAGHDLLTRAESRALARALEMDEDELLWGVAGATCSGCGRGMGRAS